MDFNNNILLIEDGIKKVQNQSSELINSIFIADYNKIGYTQICNECNCLEMIETNIEIPIDNLSSMDLDEVMSYLSIDFTTKTNLLYNDDILCHCNNDEYEMIDNEWVYVGEMIDLEC